MDNQPQYNPINNGGNMPGPNTPVVMSDPGRLRRKILTIAALVISVLAIAAAAAVWLWPEKKTSQTTTKTTTSNNSQKTENTAAKDCSFIKTAAKSTESTTASTDVPGATGAKVISADETITGQTYKAADTDQSGVLVNSGTATLNKVVIEKSGNSSAAGAGVVGGLNAGILAKGGTLNATDLTVSTTGEHSAAIASGRGASQANIACGTYTTSGVRSPGIYSASNITVNRATITAGNSEAAVIEGGNVITIENTKLSGGKQNGVMIYRNSGGDAAGSATFSAKNSTLSSQAGSMFYVTNTTGNILLTNTTLKNGSSSLLTAAAGSWGDSGKNGGSVTLTASKQTMTGAISVDKISSVSLKLTNNSSLESMINGANAGAVNITLDKTSKLILAGDSYITSLTDADSSLKNITSKGYTLYYDKTNSANSWLNGRTLSLTGGGQIAPKP